MRIKKESDSDSFLAFLGHLSGSLFFVGHFPHALPSILENLPCGVLTSDSKGDSACQRSHSNHSNKNRIEHESIDDLDVVQRDDKREKQYRVFRNVREKPCSSGIGETHCSNDDVKDRVRKLHTDICYQKAYEEIGDVRYGRSQKVFKGRKSQVLDGPMEHDKKYPVSESFRYNCSNIASNCRRSFNGHIPHHEPL